MNTVSALSVGVMAAGAVFIVGSSDAVLRRLPPPRPPPAALRRLRLGHRRFAAVVHALDLRERQIDLDLQQRLADFGRRLALVVAADAVVRIVVAGQAIRRMCFGATNSSSEVSRMLAWLPT